MRLRARLSAGLDAPVTALTVSPLTGSRHETHTALCSSGGTIQRISITGHQQAQNRQVVSRKLPFGAILLVVDDSTCNGWPQPWVWMHDGARADALGASGFGSLGVRSGEQLMQLVHRRVVAFLGLREAVRACNKAQVKWAGGTEAWVSPWCMHPRASIRGARTEHI